MAVGIRPGSESSAAWASRSYELNARLVYTSVGAVTSRTTPTYTSRSRSA